MKSLKRRPKVVIFVRHTPSCEHCSDSSYPNCQCPKHLQWSLHGEQCRLSLHTRSWDEAVSLREQKQAEVDAHYASGTHPGQDFKKCSLCKNVKPDTDFYKDSSRRGGLQSACKICKNAQKSSWQKSKPPATRNRDSILRKYGLDTEDFWVLYQIQKGLCRICQNPLDTTKGFRDIHIDHCHHTNRARWILCSLCNRGLGMFKESPKILQRAADYCKAVQSQNSRGSL